MGQKSKVTPGENSMSGHDLLELLWLTDPHLDHLDADGLTKWTDRLRAFHGQGILITGDIGEFNSILAYLEKCRTEAMPIYFVLGNHDAYGGSVAQLRNRVENYCRIDPQLNYLSEGYAFEYSPSAFLIGEDGWADGRGGDFLNSGVRLTDYARVSELQLAEPSTLFEMLKKLGDEATARLKNTIERCLSLNAKFITIATHVPPFTEACWYMGSNEINEWTPHFTCVSLGEMLRTFARTCPDVAFNVLCGHTHHFGVAAIEPNLKVWTGNATYGDWSCGRIVRMPNLSYAIRIS